VIAQVANKLARCVTGETKHVRKGQSLTLKCQAVLDDRVTWNYIPSHDDDDGVVHLVYWLDKMHSVDRRRFDVSRSQKGVFDLVISSVNSTDAGIYRCREHTGRHPGEVCFKLVVRGTIVYFPMITQSKGQF